MFMQNAVLGNANFFLTGWNELYLSGIRRTRNVW